MKLSIDEVEEAMNAVLATYPHPSMLPVIGPDGSVVGESFQDIDFFDVFGPEKQPAIYDGLRGRVILSIRGTHVRIFDTLKDVFEFSRGLTSPKRIIPGPMEQDITLEELENG